MTKDTAWSEEVRIHNSLSHPNVCGSLGYAMSGENVFVAPDVNLCGGVNCTFDHPINSDRRELPWVAKNGHIRSRGTYSLLDE